jgi:hypothetical protein
MIRDREHGQGYTYSIIDELKNKEYKSQPVQLNNTKPEGNWSVKTDAITLK